MIASWLELKARTSASAIFDRAFYGAQLAEEVTGDLLDHYLSVGWRHGLDPSPVFSTAFYLDANPDVREAGQCPLTHYVTFGAAEGRLPSRRPHPEHVASRLGETVASASLDGGTGKMIRALIDQAASPREMSKHWRRPPPESIVSRDDIDATIRTRCTSTTRGIVVSLSHDDHTQSAGGVQNCVSDEQSLLTAEGWIYLHLSPHQPLPMLSDETDTKRFLVAVRVGGEAIGTARMEDVAGAVTARTVGETALICHHLMGFSPEVVGALASKLNPQRFIFWVHDYFTLCSNPPLLRNNVSFCNGPEVTSQSCAVCVYGEERARHVARITRMLAETSPTFLTPSHAAASFWRARIDLGVETVTVTPLARLAAGPRRPIAEAPTLLRVAFLGSPLHIKGWSVFKTLARTPADPRYEFYHFGHRADPEAPQIAFVPVNVTRDKRDAMVRALVTADIDVVIQWSLCNETFSFTTYEALAAGTFIVARRAAGNVWPAIEAAGTHCGLALDREDELIDLFRSGRIFDVFHRRQAGKLEFEAGSVRHLKKDVTLV